jgi:hypothetical protein
MWRSATGILFAAAMSVATPTFGAQDAARFQTVDTARLTERQKWRLLRSYVVAATDCIAREVLKDSRVVIAVIENRLDAILGETVEPCLQELKRLVAEHDRFHGAGTGLAFVKGPYLDDLPRAVRTRVKPEIDRHMAEKKRLETKRQTAAAWEVDRLARPEPSRERLRPQMIECTDSELAAIVRFSETAEAMATTAAASCRHAIDQAMEAMIGHMKAAGNLTSPADEETARDLMRRGLHDEIAAAATRVRASALDTTASLSPPEPTDAAAARVGETPPGQLR